MSIIYYNQIIKGKKVVSSIIVITNILYVMTILLNLITGEGGSLLSQVLYIPVLIYLSFMFYKGFWFAQYGVGFSLGITLMGIVFYFLDSVGLLSYDGWLMSALMIIIPGSAMLIIITMKSISKFMEYQRNKQIKSKDVNMSYIIFFGLTSAIAYIQREFFSGVLLTISLIYYAIKLLRKSN